VTQTSDSVLAALAGLDGTVVTPGSPEYEHRRRIWNGTIDRHPAAVVTCGSVADVAATIRVAGDQGLPLAVRGGGHSLPGFSTVDGGVVLDLGGLRSVVVDPGRRLAVVGGGARWSDVDAATCAHGLATTGGLVSTTGVGGLTLGGGIGWLTRAFGLACDNLLAAQVVDSAGDVHRVDSDDPEWMWALRGGGGNFGVVTSFEFRLHPLPSVVAGMLLFPLERADEVARAYRDWADGLGDEFTTMLTYLVAPDIDDFPQEVRGRPCLAVLGCHIGTDDQADGDLAGLRALGAAADFFTRQPYAQLQQMFDADLPPGRRYYFNGVFTGACTDGMLDALGIAMDQRVSAGCEIDVHHMGGAAGRIAADATAFSGRAAAFTVNVIACWDAAADDDAHRDWVRRTAAALAPFQVGGNYVNFMGDQHADDDVRDAYGRTRYERLVAVKRRVDPENVFRLNQNIRP
jgi:FAD/FMN-containing dehydrogenase